MSQIYLNSHKKIPRKHLKLICDRCKELHRIRNVIYYKGECLCFQCRLKMGLLIW
jgi:formylmethanofuran dehydrogenase subunit E